MDVTCRGCSKNIKTANYLVCENCMNHFHPSCTSMKQVSKSGKLINACRACIASANSSRLPSDSLNDSCRENAGNTPKIKNNSESSSANSSRPNTPPPTDDMLQLIIAKLGKLDTLEASMKSLSSSINTRLDDVHASFNTRLDEMETNVNARLQAVQTSFDSRLIKVVSNVNSYMNDITSKMSALSKKLAPLDNFPQLVSSVEANAESIAELRQEQESLRCEFAQMKDSCNTAASMADPQISTRFERMEQLLHSLSSQQRLQTSDILISGFNITEDSSLRGAVLVVLKVLDPEIIDREVVDIRKINVPRTVTSSSGQSSDNLQASPTGQCNLSAGRSSDNSQASPTSQRSLKSPTLIVSLSSDALARKLSQAKLKKGKLHTTELSLEMLAEKGINVPIAPSLINVSLMLPAELHKLHKLARVEAKNLGFITFIRNGKLYIKKKNPTMRRLSRR